MVQFLSGIPMNIVDSYFFYPNINAKELIIERIDNNGVKSYSYSKLHKHETLNGVYGSINTSFSSTPDMSLITDTEIGIPYPNKIYTSDVNDPFHFPLSESALLEQVQSLDSVQPQRLYHKANLVNFLFTVSLLMEFGPSRFLLPVPTLPASLSHVMCVLIPIV